MLGAIIGNIVGSIYHKEGNRIKTKEFIFFGDSCHFRIDSVCTAAVADILLNGRQPATTMQEWCRRHRERSGSRKFKRWIDTDSPKPYKSSGNGAAMRVSPAAFLNRGDLDAALSASDKVTAITHNHPEGMKGARATTHAIWLAYQDENAEDIREVVVTEYGYDLTKTVDEIRPGYFFDGTCKGTVPQAITCALESENFEDAIRNAVSLGGDSDTLASIAGPIAEALHGIPDTIKQQAESRYLTKASDILEVMQNMYRIFDVQDDRRHIRHGSRSINCPNCDPEWRLVGISHRFAHRYGYGHVDNEFAISRKSMKYRIVEPDLHRRGWIRMVEINGTNRTFREIGYASEPLDRYWEYHQLSCGCKTIVLSDLREIPNMRY
ncbi:MAG: ADP-ribosylglycohydrolase family protein [Candidatus Poribacteria bacterium]|nr:ADP-ribosylglycohydrolase family protein [Candidatus Poribacteria bacterium]